MSQETYIDKKKKRKFNKPPKKYRMMTRERSNTNLIRLYSK